MLRRGQQVTHNIHNILLQLSALNFLACATRVLAVKHQLGQTSEVVIHQRTLDHNKGLHREKKAITVTSERAQFHPQRLSRLPVDGVNADAVVPQQQPDIAATRGPAPFNRTDFADGRGPSHLRVSHAPRENGLEGEDSFGDGRARGSSSQRQRPVRH